MPPKCSPLMSFGIESLSYSTILPKAIGSFFFGTRDLDRLSP